MRALTSASAPSSNAGGALMPSLTHASAHSPNAGGQLMPSLTYWTVLRHIRSIPAAR